MLQNIPNWQRWNDSRRDRQWHKEFRSAVCAGLHHILLALGGASSSSSWTRLARHVQSLETKTIRVHQSIHVPPPPQVHNSPVHMNDGGTYFYAAYHQHRCVCTCIVFLYIFKVDSSFFHVLDFPILIFSFFFFFLFCLKKYTKRLTAPSDRTFQR
jgi:hypothetical protein